MARSFKIYTAGKMYGSTLDEQMAWRRAIEAKIRARTDADVTFIHPPLYYRYEEHLHKSERELFSWELSQIRNSDIVIVRLDGVKDSVGTLMELGFVDGANQSGGRTIHVVGVGKADTDHPWINLSLLRREQSPDDAAEYIASYLLV